MNIDDQQGQDITASDMVAPEEDSDIKRFYRNSNVFITGATGFLGKLAMEKLLRSTDVKCVYILLRPKKGKDIKQRLEEIFNEPIFDGIKRNQPTFRDRVRYVVGDISVPDLGLSELDKQTLIQEVDCVLHFAATVRFDEKLRTATYINVRGVRDLLRISKQIKNLRAFVYVSTAFSNCIQRDTIEEKIYDPPISGEKLITIVECLEDKQLDEMTKILIQEHPNTYSFTKCVAEDLIKTESCGLPVAIYRPSIVVSTAKEPVAGWIDNFYGATGIMIGAAIGLLRSMTVVKQCNAEIVPADMVVNSCLAALWDVGTRYSTNNVEHSGSRAEENVRVYNYVSSVQNAITWDMFRASTRKHGYQVPSEKCVWKECLILHSNHYEFLFCSFFLHTIPAYLIDFILRCLGKKPMLVKGYQKINKLTTSISYFAIQDWTFKNDNIQAMWKKMKRQDRDEFDFNIGDLDWDSFFYTFMRGARVYLIKDPLETIPQGKKKMRKLIVAHYTVVTIFTLLLLRFLYYLITTLLNIII